jgi:hypothetical protein
MRLERHPAEPFDFVDSLLSRGKKRKIRIGPRCDVNDDGWDVGIE